MSYINGMAPRYRPFQRAQYLLALAVGAFSDEVLRMTCYADYAVSKLIAQTWTWAPVL